MTAEVERADTRTGFVRGQQSFVAGLTLLALSAFALWLTSDLPQGTLRAMGPAMLPRWLAIGVGLCGAALVVYGLIRRGDPLESFTFRGPLVVIVAILAFGVAIRGAAYAGLSIPGLGLVVAGPLAIFIGGGATPEVRWRELLILALALTAFCMILFGDLLNLPIPLYPQWFSDLYPAGWSNDTRLRTTAGILIGLSLVIWIAGRSRARPHEPVDVADHSSMPGQRGRI